MGGTDGSPLPSASTRCRPGPRRGSPQSVPVGPTPDPPPGAPPRGQPVGERRRARLPRGALSLTSPQAPPPDWFPRPPVTPGAGGGGGRGEERQSAAAGGGKRGGVGGSRPEGPGGTGRPQLPGPLRRPVPAAAGGAGRSRGRIRPTPRAELQPGGLRGSPWSGGGGVEAAPQPWNAGGVVASPELGGTGERAGVGLEPGTAPSHPHGQGWCTPPPTPNPRGWDPGAPRCGASPTPPASS